MPGQPLVVDRVATEHEQVALTFDACSTRHVTGFDPEVVEVLRNAGASATLFLGGGWMERYPEQTLKLHADPLFELGNHSYYHPDLVRSDAETVRREIRNTQSRVRALTGEYPTLFRAPFGRVSSRLVTEAAAQGLVTVQFDVASGDADASADPSEVAEYVLDQVRPGSIVVLHMNNPDLPTARALPSILDGLAEQGLKPVTVSRLLEDGAGKDGSPGDSGDGK